MRKVLTDGGPGTEFWRAFETFKRSAWRWEQQPAYHLGYEQAQFDQFLAGHPESPLENEELGSWMKQVAAHVNHGRTIGRVRIVETPPTDYQRWMRWMDKFNRGAGETIQYLTRHGAQKAGIIPGIGAEDWWLFDDRRLLLMRHDDKGRRVRVEAVEDEPEVEKAIWWRAQAIAAANREAASLEV
ncbi:MULTISPECIES: DUF6879 family protein [unclassified Actinoplanes]|uniref:DUF6879 family protein n=1 Tax=unclassified Actinoplanes TaxID=2626549 RepID=UPI00043A2FB2|nr:MULTISPECIES: DUF6879 family protein [unclassified Actinoplanes]